MGRSLEALAETSSVAALLPQLNQPLQRFAIDSAQADPKRYRGLVLANGMRVLLASDAENNKAAAALTAHVGSMSNPEPWPGLAHFLEHMLFLGTERFAEGDFEQFVATNGGTNNAYTDAEETTFFFDIGSPALAGGLDRFSDFFVAPLFSESATAREVAAIESEHQKNLQSDARRLEFLLKTQARPEHPYARFFTGNRQTLQDGSARAREALLAFYRRYYRASEMSLTLTGPQSLEALEALATSRFGRVSRGQPRPPAAAEYELLPPPFAAGSTTALLAVPVRDARSVTLSWCVPIGQWDAREWGRTKPDQMLTAVISSRGAGSVAAALRAAGLATRVEAVVEERTSSFVLISVYMALTEAGLRRWDEAVAALCSYLRALRERGVPEHVLREARYMCRLEFEIAEPRAPRAFARYLVLTLDLGTTDRQWRASMTARLKHRVLMATRRSDVLTSRG